MNHGYKIGRYINQTPFFFLLLIYSKNNSKMYN